MSKIAFVYPGQGVQTVGMAQDFYENSVLSKEVFDKADQVLDFDIKKICFQENQEINDTEYTQAFLFPFSSFLSKYSSFLLYYPCLVRLHQGLFFIVLYYH